MIHRTLLLCASVVLSALLSGCVVPAPYYYPARTGYAQAPYAVQPGVTGEAARPMEWGHVANIQMLQGPRPASGTSGSGALVGGLMGGAIGNQMGGGSGHAGATLLGLVGGMFLGSLIEAQNNAQRVPPSYRVSIQTEQGAVRAFDVPSPGDLRIGDRVRMDRGQISRF